MRQLALWLGITLLPSCCVFAGATRNVVGNSSLVSQLERETVAVVHFVDSNGDEIDIDDPITPADADAKLRAFCTGVWVSDDVFLTAEHCVDDIGRPKKLPEPDADDDPGTVLRDMLKQLSDSEDWSPVGQPLKYSERGDIDTKRAVYHTAQVIAVDKDDDMALVRADSHSDHVVAHLSRREPQDGDETHLIGNEAGLWWSYRHGYVASHRPEHSNGHGHVYDVLQVSAPIFFGDSGGPAFDSDGSLIGMCDAIIEVPSVAYYIHLDRIRSFLTHERVITER